MTNKQTAKKTRLGKCVLAGAVAMAFLMAGAQAFAGEIENLKVSNPYVTIEGDIARQAVGAPVVLLVTNSDIDIENEQEWLDVSGNEIAYYAEATLDDNKEYKFSFKLNVPGIYNVYLASKAKGVEKSKLIYIDEDKSQDAIEAALLTEDDTQLQTALENKLSDLGVFEFTAEDFNSEAAALLYAEIEDMESIESDDMILLTEKAIFASKINAGTLDSFYDYPEALLLTDEIFNHLTEDISETVIDNMGTSISDIEEFDNLIVEATVLTLANQRDGATLLKNALNDYKTELGITRTITDNLCEAIIAKPSFSDFDSLKTAIQDYKEKRPGSVGGTGGGTGGGSSNSSGKVNVGDLNDIISSKDNTTTTPEEILPFDDIENVPWANEAILKLYKDKVLNGKSKNKFCPLDNVTRAEFAKMLMLAFDVKLIDDDFPFTDVSQDEWCYPYVRSAYLVGVVKGIDNVTFGKEQNITRQDLCTMLYRLLTIGKPELADDNANSDFNDADAISDYALTAISFMQKNGIVNGDESKNFRPTSFATRAEAAKIIYNAMILYGSI